MCCCMKTTWKNWNPKAGNIVSMEDICSEKVNRGDKEEMLSGRECKPASSKETSLVLCEPHLGRLSIGNSNGTHRDPPEIKSGRKFCLERVQASLLVTCELLPRPGRLANATHATANGRHSHTHPPSPLRSTYMSAPLPLGLLGKSAFHSKWKMSLCLVPHYEP